MSILITRSFSGGASQGIQSFLMLILPLILGWVNNLVFLAPFSSRKGKFIIQRLPQVLYLPFSAWEVSFRLRCL
ncbi:MAG: hypothetical protein WAV93_13650 [Bacteroidales bacterium]